MVVPDYQLSLAIGKEGQNARLAARLTGWRIDIRSDAAPPEPVTPTAASTLTWELAEAVRQLRRLGRPGRWRGPGEARAVPQQARDAGIGAVSDNAGKS